MSTDKGKGKEKAQIPEILELSDREIAISYPFTDIDSSMIPDPPLTEQEIRLRNGLRLRRIAQVILQDAQDEGLTEGDSCLSDEDGHDELDPEERARRRQGKQPEVLENPRSVLDHGQFQEPAYPSFEARRSGSYDNLEDEGPEEPRYQAHMRADTLSPRPRRATTFLEHLEEKVFQEEEVLEEPRYRAYPGGDVPELPRTLQHRGQLHEDGEEPCPVPDYNLVQTNPGPMPRRSQVQNQDPSEGPSTGAHRYRVAREVVTGPKFSPDRVQQGNQPDDASVYTIWRLDQLGIPYFDNNESGQDQDRPKKKKKRFAKLRNIFRRSRRNSNESRS